MSTVFVSRPQKSSGQFAATSRYCLHLTGSDESERILITICISEKPSDVNFSRCRVDNRKSHVQRPSTHQHNNALQMKEERYYQQCINEDNANITKSSGKNNDASSLMVVAEEEEDVGVVDVEVLLRLLSFWDMLY